VARDTLPAFLINTLVVALLTIPLALASWHWLERPLAGLAARRGRRGRGAGRRPA
jgi:peptidoglycan/LPS O-acetylase OafA/YrhL